MYCISARISPVYDQVLSSHNAQYVVYNYCTGTHFYWQQTHHMDRAANNCTLDRPGFPGLIPRVRCVRFDAVRLFALEPLAS